MTIAEFQEFMKEIDEGEEIGKTYIDEEGSHFCHRPIFAKGADTGRKCKRNSGWGTTHPDKGACKYHGGNAHKTELMEQSKGITLNRNADITYAHVVKNEKLRNLITAEAANDQLDNLDGEIVLVRAFIKLIAEDFGLDMFDGEDEDGKLQVTRFAILSSEAKTVSSLVEDLSKLIERKYRITQMAGENVPKETVRAYMNQIQMVLGRILRNSCVKCGHEHNMLDNTFTGLSLIGGMGAN